jgi:hypothetical protein
LFTDTQVHQRQLLPMVTIPIRGLSDG